MKRVALPTKDGYEFVLTYHILYFMADGNYCVIFLTDGNKKHILKSVKHIHESIQILNFVRIHQEYLINIEHLVRFDKHEGGMVLLTDGTKLPVARTRKKEFLKRVMGE
ncbi:MAG: LytTR family DNA-binding domain-containing protein [Saprospiraceae bacterium]